jgi:hypothetical protein
MKPSEIKSEVEELMKRPHRGFGLLLLVVAVAAIWSFGSSYLQEKGKQLAAPPPPAAVSAPRAP